MAKQQKTYALSAKPPQIAEAIALAAHEYAFHPVRDYLRSLAWDGTPRIETLFASYLGARGSAYRSRVAQMLFVSIVARVFQPGRKVDTVVVFESLEQGTGKTTFIHALLRPDWCVDPVETIGSRDFLMAIRGAAIVELGELSVFSRADFAKIKQAITVQVDTYRDPFARCVASYPRQCVFVGSTNQDDWNRDPTGARRFLPVRVSAIDLDGYLSVRDQVWAEAVHLFDAGTDYWTLPATAAAEVDERFDDDPWLDPIAYWLAGKCEDKKYPVEIDMRSTADGGGVRRVPAALLMQHALGIETGKHTRAEWSRVVSVMRRLGWRKERVMRNGVRAWEYVRPTEDADVVPF
jgi:predicted P-loop ATPase